jgi:hydroxymethylglutaryl-CoA synthase
MQAT